MAPEKITKMEEELEVINNSLKGKKKIEDVNVLSDTPNTKKEDTGMCTSK